MAKSDAGPKRAVKPVAGDPDSGPDYSGPDADSLVDPRQNKLQVPWRFNTGSQLDDDGAQDEEGSARDPRFSDAALEETIRAKFFVGIGQAAGESEAVRPGEADPGG